MSLPRVFFDANDGTMEHGYWLGFDRSLSDLQALGEELREGTRVTIYMPYELEMTATLRFDAIQKIWWAKPVGGTITYLEGST
jgi:hypothetical protein